MEAENKPKILMIDNYDSFTFNLVQYFEELGADVVTVRNDAIQTSAIPAIAPNAIVVSPGPGRPDTAGISMDVVRTFSGKLPLLGVCLGHQSIAGSFGANIIHAKKLMHGKVSQVTSDGTAIFKGFSKPFPAMRYHSLVVDPETLPDCFTVTATSDDGEIMGIRHREHATFGIQFHPESIMTPAGKRILRNFLKQAA